jgi:predicted nucleic acid-binding protein
MTDTQFVLDTNVIIDFTDGKITALPDGALNISVITEMELFGSPSLTLDKEQKRRDFLNELTIVPLTERIKQETIRIRRHDSPRLKLPDAIIAATAIVLDAALVTNDEKLRKAVFPGLTVQACG